MEAIIKKGQIKLPNNILTIAKRLCGLAFKKYLFYKDYFK